MDIVNIFFWRFDHEQVRVCHRKWVLSFYFFTLDSVHGVCLRPRIQPRFVQVVMIKNTTNKQMNRWTNTFERKTLIDSTVDFFCRLAIIQYCSNGIITEMNFQDSTSHNLAWINAKIDAIPFRGGKKKTLE